MWFTRARPTLRIQNMCFNIYISAEHGGCIQASDWMTYHASLFSRLGQSGVSGFMYVYKFHLNEPMEIRVCVSLISYIVMFSYLLGAA
jgi:hypothetical protein